MEERKQFGTADLVVFIGLLIVSIAIGLYYGFVDRKKKSVENYYFGERKMSTIPVGISMGVSFISAITVLGFPGHSYVYGTIAFWFGLASFLQLIFACAYYIPLLHRLHLSSVYEYLEQRFHRSVRLVASILIILAILVYLGTTLYLTSLALDAVTSIGIDLSVIITAIVCTLYTTVGGMKAVVWTDALQSVIMITGIFAVMIRTTILVGGFGKVFEAVNRGKRDTFFTFDFDVTLTHTAWAIMLGEGLSWTGATCTNQMLTQRYLTCKNATSAKRASILSTLLMMTFLLGSVYNGCAMYAYFEGCDPVEAGKLKKVDQTIVYLVLDIFSNLPGMAGLFVSAAYSGLLSTLSSGLNALSVIILQDFILVHRPNLNEKDQLTISKVTCVLFGASVLGLSFFTKYAAITVVRFSSAMAGTFKGPIMGLFVLGMHFPWTNTVGALAGAVSGIIFTMWLSLGTIIVAPKTDFHKPPVSTSACPANFTINSTMATFLNEELNWNSTVNTQSSLIAQEASNYTSVYSISYLYYGSIGLVLTVVIGLLVSAFTGSTNPKNVDPKLFVPLLYGKFLPRRVQKFFRFGVPEYYQQNHEEEIEEKFDFLLESNQSAKKDKSPPRDSSTSSLNTKNGYL